MSVGIAIVSPPTPRKPDNPVLWIVAGPNGSGKSSLYNRTDIEGWGGSVWIINPDLLTQQIVDQEGLGLYQANLTAVQRIQRWLDTSIDAYQTIGVETVLSSSKYRNLVQWARLRGFQVRMIYVLLRSASLQIERVRIRVSEGGHDVAEEKIVSRRQRSFAELSWFVRHVDQCHIYDNSTGSPTLIAERIEHPGGVKLLCWEALPKDLQETMKSAEIPLLVYTPSES